MVTALNYKLESSLDSIRKAVDYMLKGLREEADIHDEDILFDIKVILNELLSNAVKHGNKLDEFKYVNVCAGLVDSQYIYISVEDEGEGLDHDSYLDNEQSKICCNDLMKETGRGILIVKNLCDKVILNEKGNKITVLKKIQ